MAQRQSGRNRKGTKSSGASFGHFASSARHRIGQICRRAECCAPQLLDHTDGRRRMFVMRATGHRSGAHPEALAESTAGQWCRGGHDEAGQVGKQPKDDSSQEDHATIVPRLAEGPATESVRPGSNICGAQLSRSGNPESCLTRDPHPVQDGVTMSVLATLPSTSTAANMMCWFSPTVYSASTICEPGSGTTKMGTAVEPCSWAK